MKVLYQGSMFHHQGHYLFIPLNAPPWAHDYLQNRSLDKMSTFQIIEGKETYVGYEFDYQGVIQAREGLQLQMDNRQIPSRTMEV